MSTDGFPAAAIAAQELQFAMRYLVGLRRSLKNKNKEVDNRGSLIPYENVVFKTRQLPKPVVKVAK